MMRDRSSLKPFCMNIRPELYSVLYGETMKRWIVEHLLCPNDCRGELRLQVFQAHQTERDGKEIEEIDEGLLVCNKCGRWYPIIDRIACLLPDEERHEPKQLAEEKAFLERWREQIPQDILSEGKPFGLQ